MGRLVRIVPLALVVLLVGVLLYRQMPFDRADRSIQQAFVITPSSGTVVGGLQRDAELEFRSPGAYVNAVRLSTGGIAVIDWDRVHFLDVDGKPIRMVGRSGSGPGEYQYLTSICRLRGDTIVLWDDGGRRAGILTGDGEFVRHIPLVLESPSGGSCSEDGGILLTGVEPGTDGVRGFVGTGRTVRSDGEQLGESFAFNPGSLDAVSREPSLARVDSLVYLAEGIRPEVTLIEAAGKPTRSIRVGNAPKRISDREYERLADRMIPNQRQAATLRARMKALRTATHWPAYGRMLVDPAGCIWIEERVVTTGLGTRPSGRWLGFTTSGSLLGFLQLPASSTSRVELLRIDRGEAILRDRDSDGVVRLTFAQIRPLDPEHHCTRDRPTY